MALIADRRDDGRRSLRSLIYDAKLRGYFFQILTVIIFVWIVYVFSVNVGENLRRAHQSIDFDFLKSRAGFDVGQTLIAYTSDATYFRALQVGLVNTLLVAGVGIVTASIVGLIVGLGRLSSNWLIARLSTIYVEIFRNIPPLLVIFFWYSGVINILPDVKNSVTIPFSMYLNNRGFYFPNPIFEEGFGIVLITLIVALVSALLFTRWARARQMATGQQYPVLITNLVIIIGLTGAAFAFTGAPLSFDLPIAGKFNLTGGANVGPEFMSLYLALSFYTAAFIAEIIRAGIRGVPHGQTEAARALGLRKGLTTRMVVLPQALRIIIPPLTSQYLNLTKNSSLAIAIGYSDFVSVGGTVLNQSSHSIEIVFIWMVVYVSISLITSLFMNWFNAKMALVER